MTLLNLLMEELILATNVQQAQEEMMVEAENIEVVEVIETEEINLEIDIEKTEEKTEE